MKTVSMIFFTVIVLSLATTASADTSGWGLGIGSFDGDFGIQGRKDIRLGGDVSHITAQGSVVFANKTTFALDADYHFVIESGKGRFYPLAGLQFAFNSDDSEFGVNAGGGLNFMLTDKMAAFGEVKYVFFGWEGWFITGGVYF
jgi:hypothetical protein